ncbi:MAG: hypothetical protein SP4CHLAM5_05960 [Chlamydiia bacterium]|nr:hypothetical protein [Chlamydiia bacterium]MCH9618465.1 hypothetical protein [Chlamydiia bacterium]MCH9623927.1 hypothetical protein [Chlamydiia bacterium]
MLNFVVNTSFAATHVGLLGVVFNCFNELDRSRRRAFGSSEIPRRERIAERAFQLLLTVSTVFFMYVNSQILSKPHLNRLYKVPCFPLVSFADVFTKLAILHIRKVYRHRLYNDFFSKVHRSLNRLFTTTTISIAKPTHFRKPPPADEPPAHGLGFSERPES